MAYRNSSSKIIQLLLRQFSVEWLHCSAVPQVAHILSTAPEAISELFRVVFGGRDEWLRDGRRLSVAAGLTSCRTASRGLFSLY